MADAGFASYAFCRKLILAKHAFLLRVGGNLRLLTELGYYAEEKDGWVYLWPKTHRHGEPLVLRLIVLKTQNAAIGKCSRRKAKPLGEP